MDAVYLGIVNQMHAAYAGKSASGRPERDQRKALYFHGEGDGETGFAGKREKAVSAGSDHTSSFSELSLDPGTHQGAGKDHNGPVQLFPVFQPL